MLSIGIDWTIFWIVANDRPSPRLDVSLAALYDGKWVPATLFPRLDDPPSLAGMNLLSLLMHSAVLWRHGSKSSDVFRDFLLATLNEGDDVWLLFTSEPTRDKVEDYLGAIHPAVGLSALEGDVRLEFDQKWQVLTHSIAVPAV
ncbi:hypothetical protein [Blastomonas fulva]|uniref:hypothetical protein n=1 Tax=Blastomonas fulva TaxID=1550728 RepID=UPI003D2BB904